MITEIPERPVLRYHGGKWNLAPWIISHFPKHRFFVEPFGGSAAVLLRKPPSHAEVYNDLDGEIVNVFRVARDHGAELKRRIELTPFAREEFDLSYEPAIDSVEQARRTIVRAFLGHSSASASGQKSGFRRRNGYDAGSSVGTHWRNFPDGFEVYISRLKSVVIENRDARCVMIDHDGPETLHYIDPPYLPSTRDYGRDYRHEMTDSDHGALAQTLHGLCGMVCLSGYHSTLYDTLYTDWRRVERKAYADGARERTEVLWMNYPCDDDRLL